jgi:glycosyltransferase involved in cell wall biosynthesis
MYPPQHLGGYETVWQGAVEHLRRAGHDVSVLATDVVVHEDAVDADPPWVARDLRWFWHDHEWPALRAHEALDVARDDNVLLHARIRELSPDAVLFWAMGGLPLGLLDVPRRRGVPAGAVVHDGWPVYGPEVDAWGQALAVRRGLRAVARRIPSLPGAFAPGAVDAWSFNSAWLRDEVCARVDGIDRAATRVDHPGIEAARYAGVPEAGPWGWRLACVGRIDERKGIAVAIAALADLPAEATLTVAGAGDEAHLAELRALAERSGVAGRVTFTGAVADVAGVYAAADAVLFPVIWDEPFGLVPLEAMAAGRPVVATGTGGSAEFLDDDSNALLVPRGDAPALAAAARRLADDAALRARLVTAGRRTAAEHPSSAFDEAIERLAGDLTS